MPVKSAVSILDSENVFIEDTLANKYKENPREMAREKRHLQMERDAQNRFQKKLEDWLSRESAKEKAKIREEEKLRYLERERLDLIKQDMEFDEVDQKRRRKRDLKAYQRYMEDKRRIREREREEDAADAKVEKEELAVKERERQELLRIEEERRKREEDIKERMKLKKFLEM